MIFTELPEEEVLSAIEGHESILEGLDAAAKAKVDDVECPDCSTPAHPAIDPKKPFRGTTFNYIARCPACSRMWTLKGEVRIPSTLTLASRSKRP